MKVRDIFLTSNKGYSAKTIWTVTQQHGEETDKTKKSFWQKDNIAQTTRTTKAAARSNIQVFPPMVTTNNRHETIGTVPRVPPENEHHPKLPSTTEDL